MAKLVLLEKGLERRRLESDNTEETPEPTTAQDTDIQNKEEGD